MKSILALFEGGLEEDRKVMLKMKDILQTSLELFSSQSYSNSSTKEVAQVADVAEDRDHKKTRNLLTMRLRVLIFIG